MKNVKQNIVHGRWFSLSGKLLNFVLFVGLLGLAVYLAVYAIRQESILLGIFSLGALLLDWFFVINPTYRKHKGDIGPYIVIRILAPLLMWMPAIVLFMFGVVVSGLVVKNALAETTPKDAMWVLLYIALLLFAIFVWVSIVLWRRLNKRE